MATCIDCQAHVDDAEYALYISAIDGGENELMKKIEVRLE